MDKEEIKKNVSQNISKCVKASGKSIGQITRDLDISRTTLSNYCNGTFVPTIYIAYRIMMYFDISLDELLGLDKTDANASSGWLELGVSRKVFRDLASLPYEKKKVVVDMINVLSRKG